MSSIPGFLPAWILVTGVWRDTEATGTDRRCLWSNLCPRVDGPVGAIGVLIFHQTSTLPLGAHYENMIQ